MRTTKDRIRHTILFETGLILIFIPIIMIVLKKDILQVGSLTICLSIIAMVVNYFYNLLFDCILVKLKMSLTKRSVKLRILHSILFEASLLTVALPVIASILDIPIWQAFLTDIGFSIFTVVYAFVFNWTYDCFLPIKEIS